jgi:feruloyl esterase
VSFTVGAASARADSCSDLAKLSLPNTTITGATIESGTVEGVNGLPSFCRVQATLTPSPTSDIKVEVWMPTTGWNNDLQAVGNGGLAGTISYSAMGPALEGGYATTSTDTGHSASQNPPIWLTDADQERDNGYRAIHLMTVFAKEVIFDFYGSSSRYTYFNGCSTGGGQGIGEAQSYPDDYDGILAGAPQIFATHIRAEYIQDFQATIDPATNLPASSLSVLTQAALKTCGDKYALEDGFLPDALTCHFDPKVTECRKGQDPSTCLTPAQVEAASKFYAGLSDPKTHEQIWPGLMPGSENSGGGGISSWLARGINGPNPSSFVDFFWGVYDNFNLDFHTLDAAATALLADEKFPYIDHIDTDLDAFMSKGHKLLIYHGEADPLITPRSTVDYYGNLVENTKKRHGDPDDGHALRELEESARLFLVPGMGHCGGGPGPTTFDAFTPLRNWVENRVPPNSIPASRLNVSGETTFSRPLCPYPQQASWKGTGDRSDAANWVCINDRADFDDQFYDYWDKQFGISW